MPAESGSGPRPSRRTSSAVALLLVLGTASHCRPAISENSSVRETEDEEFWMFVDEFSDETGHFTDPFTLATMDTLARQQDTPTVPLPSDAGRRSGDETP